MSNVRLRDLIKPAGRKAGCDVDLPVYSVTKHEGFIPSLEYFNKQVYSRNIEGYKLVEPGQFAYATIHLDEGSIGIAPERALISPMYTVFEVDDSHVDPRYLIRFLKSPRALSHYAQIGQGAVHRRKAIPLSSLGTVPVQLPSLEEQRRTAEILDQADAIRAKRRQVVTLLNDLADSIFLEVFGDPVKNPYALPVHRLGDEVASMQYGPRFYNESYSSDGIRIVRITDLDRSGNLNFEKMPRMAVAHDQCRKFQLSPGDIVFARTGATVGKLAIIRDSDPPSIAGAYFIRIRLSDLVLPDYAASVLRSRSMQSIIWAKSQQSAQQNFSGPGLRSLPLPVPPLELQREFATRVEQINAQRAVVQRALDADNELFASLQAQAFCGEL